MTCMVWEAHITCSNKHKYQTEIVNCNKVSEKNLLSICSCYRNKYKHETETETANRKNLINEK